MVFFSCDACGESLKKNQVEKHLFRCRRCEVLTCIDCQKAFWGEDYKLHLKCISENEKYGGKDYQPKSSAGKGERAQENWISNIRNYIETTKISPAIEKMLTTLLNHDNVPRKQARFKNFCKSSFHVKNDDHINQIWEIFCKANEAKKPTENSLKQSSEVEENNLKEIKSCEKLENGSQSISDPETENSEVKKKRKKKGEQSGVELDLSNLQNEDSPNNPEDVQSSENVIEQVDSTNTVKKRKKKKSKLNEQDQEYEHSQTDGAIQETEITPTDITKKGKKKKKSKNVDTNDTAIVDNNNSATETKHKEKYEIADDFVLNEEQVSDDVPVKSKKKRSKNDVGINGSTVLDNDDSMIEVKRKKKSTLHPDVEIQNDIELNDEQRSEDGKIKSKKNKKRKEKHSDHL